MRLCLPSATTSRHAPAPFLPAVIPIAAPNRVGHVASHRPVAASSTCTRLLPVSATYTLPLRYATSRGSENWPLPRPRIPDRHNNRPLPA